MAETILGDWNSDTDQAATLKDDIRTFQLHKCTHWMSRLTFFLFVCLEVIKYEALEKGDDKRGGKEKCQEVKYRKRQNPDLQ